VQKLLRQIVYIYAVDNQIYTTHCIQYMNLSKFY